MARTINGLGATLDAMEAAMGPFFAWSPAQLAHALGYRVDLRSQRNGTRDPWLVGPTGREHETSLDRACLTLARLARWRGIDPAAPPAETPRALRNGVAP